MGTDSANKRIRMGKDPAHKRIRMVKDSAHKNSRTLNMSDFPRCNGKTGDIYFQWVSDILSGYRCTKFELNSPPGATLVIGPLEDTVYRDSPAEVNGWGKFYLPKTVEMKVVGYVEGTPYPCDQLVLMTCEEQKFYAYDEEELHLVAPSLEHLREKGVDYPASESFYKGEAFKDMTKEDWAKVRKGPVGKKLDEEHHKLVSLHKSSLLENLKLSRQKQRCHQKHGSSLPDDVFRQFVQRGGT